MLSTGMNQQQDSVDPWLLCTMGMSPDKPLAIRGPVYNAEIMVDGVRIRALLNHEAQVSLVRKEPNLS